jgi:hypothetical protein
MAHVFQISQNTMCHYARKVLILFIPLHFWSTGTQLSVHWQLSEKSACPQRAPFWTCFFIASFSTNPCDQSTLDGIPTTVCSSPGLAFGRRQLPDGSLVVSFTSGMVAVARRSDTNASVLDTCHSFSPEASNRDLSSRLLQQ